jgi:epsilon-lactone hydrolase
MGSVASHLAMVSHIAQACQAKALIINYKLAPENPFPSALNDVMAVYENLLATYPAKNIVLMGDSAGGGLALATLLKIKEKQIALPYKAVLLAPWLDLTCENPTLDTLAHKDPVLYKSELIRRADLYAGGYPKNHPMISPFFADLSGLPPLLIQVGTLDILLGENKYFVQKAQANGVKVSLEVWKNMIHIWHYLGDKLPEAPKAIRRIASFVRKEERM